LSDWKRRESLKERGSTLVRRAGWDWSLLATGRLLSGKKIKEKGEIEEEEKGLKRGVGLWFLSGEEERRIWVEGNRQAGWGKWIAGKVCGAGGGLKGQGERKGRGGKKTKEGELGLVIKGNAEKCREEVVKGGRKKRGGEVEVKKEDFEKKRATKRRV